MLLTGRTTRSTLVGHQAEKFHWMTGFCLATNWNGGLLQVTCGVISLLLYLLYHWYITTTSARYGYESRIDRRLMLNLRTRIIVDDTLTKDSRRLAALTQPYQSSRRSQDRRLHHNDRQTHFVGLIKVDKMPLPFQDDCIR